MYLSADPGRTDEVIRYGTYTVSPDPDSMNPDPNQVSVSGSES